MQSPIIGFCEGDLAVFPNKECAEGYIEPIDVENGEWEVYDAAGRLLILSVTSKAHWIPFLSTEYVIVSDSRAPRYKKERLRDLLIRNLSSIADKEKSKLGLPTDDSGLQAMRLDELIQYAQLARIRGAI